MAADDAGSTLAQPLWSKGEAQRRFLELVGAQNFDQVKVPIPPELRTWSEDQLRRLLLSDEDMNNYVYAAYHQELDQIEAEAEQTILAQNLDKLKERYQKELIPAANALNDKTAAYNAKIETLNTLNQAVEKIRENMSRDAVLDKLSQQLIEHQRATSQVVDETFSKESHVTDAELQQLVDGYTQRRVEWYRIKDKLDFVERNGVPGV